MSMIDSILEKNAAPDFLIRHGIRKLLAQRLCDEHHGDVEAQQEHHERIIAQLKASPIAVQTQAANAQHYEVPTEFYRYVMGRHMKYSCGYWKPGVTDLDQSEADMLTLTCQRAELTSSQNVLELGCGWGSLSLYMAQAYPRSTFTGVSNSRTQKIYIDEQARQRGLTNLTIMTADMNTFEAPATYDRVVSVEMFEHMRNYEKLLEKVSRWLKPEGKLFIHIFTHKEYTYLFDAKDDTDWMSKYFFTGGVMPSDHLLLHFAKDFAIENHWRVNGQHYQKTSEAWLANMDRHRTEILPIFEKTYGKDHVVKWWAYWRIFFMSCAELWGYRGGNEWFVSHYLFKKR